MPGYMTDDEAKKFNCPVARTFEDGKKATCDGSKCMMWRAQSVLKTNQFFMSAVKREEACLAVKLNKGLNPDKYHKAAVANVAADPEGYGVISDRGYCGLGGRP